MLLMIIFLMLLKNLQTNFMQVQTIFENILQLHANPPHTCMLLHQLNLATS